MDYEGRLKFVNDAGEKEEEGQDDVTPNLEVWDQVFGGDALSLIRRINPTHVVPDPDVVKLNEEAV